MKSRCRTKAHNRTLDSEIEELKESCQGLKQLKESLENQKDSMRENLTDTQKEAQQYKVWHDGFLRVNEYSALIV